MLTQNCFFYVLAIEVYDTKGNSLQAVVSAGIILSFLFPFPLDHALVTIQGACLFSSGNNITLRSKVRLHPGGLAQ